MIYGYCRISTSKQNIERQVRNIREKFPDAMILQEVFTGAKIARPRFEWMLKVAKSGDTIVFDEVSRMSRNADEGFETYMELFNRDVNLVFLKEPEIGTDRYREGMKKQIGKIETGSDITDKLLNAVTDALQEYMTDLAKKQIADAFARSQAELDYLHRRTKEGIETARLNGRQIGQPKGSGWYTKKSKAAKKKMLEVNKAFGGSLNDEDTWKVCGISRNSFYKYKRELLQEEGE